MGMVVQGINTTGSTETYVSGAISIPANSTISISLDLINSLLFDGQALSDINAGNLNIGDGVNTYVGTQAVQFLQLACQFYNQSDKPTSGSLTAAQPTQGTPVSGGTVVADTNGSSTVGFTILGTWSGTIGVDGTFDGTDWFALSALNLSNGQSSLSFTSNTNLLLNCGGLIQVRVRMTAYTSGTANITANAALGNNVLQMTNLIASNLLIGVNGVFNSSQPTPSSGSYVPMQMSPFGDVSIAANTKYLNITTATTTTVKSSKGLLYGVTVNTPVNGATATIYDNTSGSGTKIGTLTLNYTLASLTTQIWTPTFTYYGGVQFSTGLTIVTTGAADWTILYK